MVAAPLSPYRRVVEVVRLGGETFEQFAERTGNSRQAVQRTFRAPVPCCPDCGRPQVESIHGKRLQKMREIAEEIGVDLAELLMPPPEAA